MSSSSDFHPDTSSTETLAETTKATAGSAAENTKDFLEDLVGSIREEIEEHPTRTLLIAGGLGLAIGALWMTNRYLVNYDANPWAKCRSDMLKRQCGIFTCDARPRLRYSANATPRSSSGFRRGRVGAVWMSFGGRVGAPQVGGWGVTQSVQNSHHSENCENAKGYWRHSQSKQAATGNRIVRR